MSLVLWDKRVLCVIGLSKTISLELLVGLKQSDDKTMKRAKIAIVVLAIGTRKEWRLYAIFEYFIGFEVKY